LPIDKISPAEQQDYLQFRSQYLNLWRRFFDPVGVRLSINKNQVRIDTYILPLLRNNRYDELRAFTGGGTTTLDPAAIPPTALLQFLAHLSPDTPMGNSPFGDWAMVRLDDSPLLDKLAEFWIRQQWI